MGYIRAIETARSNLIIGLIVGNEPNPEMIFTANKVRLPLQDITNGPGPSMNQKPNQISKWARLDRMVQAISVVEDSTPFMRERPSVEVSDAQP